MHLPVVILSGLLSASFVSSAFLDRRDTFALGVLQARQVSNNACTSICTPFETAVTGCPSSDPLCYCTSAVETTLQDCVNCAVAASSTPAVITSAQNLTSLFDDACSGKNLPTPTIPAFLPANPSATGPDTVIPTTSGVSATTTTSLVPFSTDSILPTQLTILPSSTSSAGATATTSAKSSAVGMEAAHVLSLVGVGAAIVLGVL
ncbi:hypothetical protein HYPSUDRAFT_206778 [Hypholoma sublateritium FD-334 SS-4]|uniref:Extracellular membrane protein CFEM domain-containing protein n=1 Tax=Hypholoma sublateritium (strain FD-334 SS-4) TaxID=945553 RepID=A0A0D2KQ89_HYPSF|nr:hypothetical protein HYPSUDRAFT_206778 [Hypholoma sublateritium FD-334 SS-4]